MARAAGVGGYELLEVLGIGGVGVVYLARRGEEQVVVKLLREGEKGGIWNGWARFRHEAMALRRLRHPAIVRLIETGELPDGQPFLVLEYARGEPLSRILARQGRLEVADALRVVLEVLGALAQAHDRGVIHRDLKPDNIMLEGFGPGLKVKVLDFGLAQMVDGPIAATALTGTDMIVGTPRYMAPEQLSKGPLDGRCDLYALGLIWFEMCEGGPFLGGDSPSEMLARRVVEQAPSLEGLDLGGLSAGLRGVLARTLRADPGERYGSAREMLGALREVIGGNIRVSRRRGFHRRMSGGLAQVLVGLVSAALVGILGWWVMGGSQREVLEGPFKQSVPQLQTLDAAFVVAQRLLGDVRLAAWEMHRGADGAWTMWAWFIAVQSLPDPPQGGCVVELQWGESKWKIGPEVGRCGVKAVDTPRCEPRRVLDTLGGFGEGPVSMRYTQDAQGQGAWMVEAGGAQHILRDRTCAGAEAMP